MMKPCDMWTQLSAGATGCVKQGVSSGLWCSV